MNDKVVAFIEIELEKSLFSNNIPKLAFEQLNDEVEYSEFITWFRDLLKERLDLKQKFTVKYFDQTKDSDLSLLQGLLNKAIRLEFKDDCLQAEEDVVIKYAKTIEKAMKHSGIFNEHFTLVKKES